MSACRERRRFVACLVLSAWSALAPGSPNPLKASPMSTLRFGAGSEALEAAVLADNGPAVARD